MRALAGQALAAVLLAAALAAPAPTARAGRDEELSAVRQAIERSRARVTAYESEQRGLLDALEELDRTAQVLEREVREARRRAEAARRELGALEAEATALEARVAATHRALAARATALYRTGDHGSLRLLFSAGGLREFLGRVQLLRRLVARDADLLARHRAESESLGRAREAARASSLRLAGLSRELSERQAELATERQTKRGIVSRLYADRARERAALAELETAARALEETLAGLGPGVAPSPGGTPFVALRRRLEPPVEGAIVRGFGRVVDGEFRTETFRSGVVFDAPAGAEVRAVAAGRVRYAGWFRGYGRIVILDHGGGYYTVSGHLAEILVGVGDGVASGVRIGSVGETGSLSGPSLYFEIRRGAEALDPREWLAELGRG